MGIETILCLDNSVLDHVRGADILNDFMSFLQACEQLWLCAAFHSQMLWTDYGLRSLAKKDPFYNKARCSRSTMVAYSECSRSLPRSGKIFINIFVSLALLCSHGACIYYIGTEQKLVVLQCHYSLLYSNIS